MSLQTRVSTETLEERKAGIGKDWVRPVIISTISGIITGIAVGIAQYRELKRIEHNIQAEKDQRLLGLQGVWLLAHTQMIQGWAAVIAVDHSFEASRNGLAVSPEHSEKRHRSASGWRGNS